MPRFRTERQETLLPDDAKSAEIFSRLGYRIADAIADIIDNSVDAGATQVHIRFVRRLDGIHSVIISDNGSGMTAAELTEAMRFGSRNNKSDIQLGKYGIGLKSASLSQAEKVTVLSKRRGSFAGRRWTLANVKNHWACDILHSTEVSQAFEMRFGGCDILDSGTMVIWEELEHLRALPHHISDVLAKTKKELQTELGIRFHRFLSSDRLSIAIDEQMLMEEPGDVCTYITALDPFGYEQSPHQDYPVTFALDIAGSTILAECHIWPPKSNAINYRLGRGKVALRQGFYFYRNERVIQAGGWNKLRADDGEPHLSLARVKVEVPSSLDSLFKLDVTKSRLDPAPEFLQALQGATARNGITFDDYIEKADKVYRKKKTEERARFPLIPGQGLSGNAQKAIASILKERGAGRPIKISFKWRRLDSDEIVRVVPGESVVSLNSRYRSELSEGGSNDAPVLKVALMFLLQDEICKSFSTKVSAEWIQRINHALLASLKT